MEKHVSKNLGIYPLSIANKAFCEPLLFKVCFVVFPFINNWLTYNLTYVSPINFQQTIPFNSYLNFFSKFSVCSCNESLPLNFLTFLNFYAFYSNLGFSFSLPLLNKQIFWKEIKFDFDLQSKSFFWKIRKVSKHLNILFSF